MRLIEWVKSFFIKPSKSSPTKFWLGSNNTKEDNAGWYDPENPAENSVPDPHIGWSTVTQWNVTNEGYLKFAKEYAEKYGWKLTGNTPHIGRLSFKRENDTLFVWFGTRRVKLVRRKKEESGDLLKTCKIGLNVHFEYLEHYFK